MANRTYNSGYSAGVAPTGLWRAIVKSVDNEKHISITIPKLSNDIVYTQVKFTGATPDVGDEVYVSMSDGSMRSYVALTGSDAGLSSVYGTITSPFEPFKSFDTTSGTRTLYLSESAVHWYTKPATGSWSIDVTSSESEDIRDILEAGHTVSFVVMSQNGSTAYAPSGVTVDGSSTGVDVAWEEAELPTGNPNNLDIYRFTMFKEDEYNYVIMGSVSAPAGPSITVSSSLPSGGSDGDIWMTYS